MDNIQRQARYGGGTTADVLNLIKEGREDEGLTPARRRRVKHKRGGTRREQTPRPRQDARPPEPAPEPPRVVKVFGQTWEIP